MKMIKKLALVIALVVLAVALYSCRDTTLTMDDFGNDGYILQDGRKLFPEHIMKIGDFDVTFQEYRYRYLNTKLDYDGGSNTVWEKYPEYIDILKKTVDDSLIEIYSIRSLCKEAGIESDLNEIGAMLEEYKDGMKSSDFKKGLKSHYLTESLYAYVLEGYQLYDKLFDAYFGKDGTMAMSDDEVLEYAQEYYLHTKHILIYPNTTMSESDYESRLNEALSKAQSTADFDALIKELSDDETMAECGCYFKEGEKGENYELAAKALEEGEISDLVKGSEGWYIIKRLPVDEKDVSVLRDLIYNRKYADLIESRIETIAVEYYDDYELITPDTVK